MRFVEAFFAVLIVIMNMICNLLAWILCVMVVMSFWGNPIGIIFWTGLSFFVLRKMGWFYAFKPSNIRFFLEKVFEKGL